MTSPVAPSGSLAPPRPLGCRGSRGAVLDEVVSEAPLVVSHDASSRRGASSRLRDFTCGPCRVSGALSALALALFSAACSSDEAPEGGGAEVGAGYLFQGVVEGPEGRTSYLVHLPTLPSGEVTPASGVEVAGNGRIYVHEGRAFSGAGDAPTITPLLFDDSAIRLDDERAMSLTHHGMPVSPFGHVFVSAERAYLFWEDAVVWNPASNTIAGTLSLAEAEVGGRRPAEVNLGATRGEHAFVPVVYRSFPGVDDAVHVLVIDSVQNQVAAVASDARCKSAGAVALASDGTLYVTGTSGYVLPKFGDLAEPPTCVLRILPDQLSFDPSWWIDLREATGGLDATGFQLVDDDTAVIFAFDPSALPAGTDVQSRAVYEARASRFWRLSLSAKTASPIEGLPLVASGSGLSSRLGDGTVALALPEDYPPTKNRFVRVDAAGEVTPLFSFFGRGVLAPLSAP